MGHAGTDAPPKFEKANTVPEPSIPGLAIPGLKLPGLFENLQGALQTVSESAAAVSTLKGKDPAD